MVTRCADFRFQRTQLERLMGDTVPTAPNRRQHQSQEQRPQPPRSLATRRTPQGL